MSQEFWKIADATQAQTERLANAKFTDTERCDIETLRRLLVQYRFFTIYYISDLAYLIAKLPFGKLRSFMAHILNEELGMADEKQAHPELYDTFLRSIGVDDAMLESGIARNLAMLEEIQQALIREPYPYGVGLRGMGGECMCQIYLANLHSHFIHNPYIQAHREQIDWGFWDIHVGPVDVHHREETRALLNQLILKSPELSRQISDGFQASIRTWDQFWTNIVEAAAKPAVETKRYERRSSTRRAGATGELVANLVSHLDPNYPSLVRGSSPRIPAVARGTMPLPLPASEAEEPVTLELEPVRVVDSVESVEPVLLEAQALRATDG